MRTAFARAFRIGLADRMAGRPLMVRYPDSSARDRAYMRGYDPRNDLQLLRPAYVASETAAAASMAAELGIELPAALPRNACEFPRG